MTEPTDQRDTTTIAGMFAEALDCIEEALCQLEAVNKQYGPEHHMAEIRIRFCNPATDFWLQTANAEHTVKDILRKLRRIEPLAPKEVVP